MIIGNNYNYQHGLWIDSVADSLFRNFAISHIGTGLSVGNIFRTTFRTFRIYEPHDSAMDSSGLYEGFLLDDIVVDGNGYGYGLDLIVEYIGKDNRISNCVVRNVANTAFYVKTEPAGGENSYPDVTYLNCHARDSETGFAVTGGIGREIYGVRYIGCTVSNCTNPFSFSYAHDIIRKGCTVDRKPFTNSGTATIANNEWVPHGLAGTPTVVTVTTKTATYGTPAVAVVVGWIGQNSTHFQVSAYWTNSTAITDDAINISWYAEV